MLTASSPCSQALISVGIPTYNRADLLERRIVNVLAQSYDNLEIIVSDNASPDPTVQDVCQKWASTDSRVKVYAQSENIGPHNNFLFVLAKANGKFFAWAADDDEWDADYLREAISMIGSAQLAMPKAAVHYLLSGNKHHITLPQLSPVKSQFLNSKLYLNNAQPTLLYGLHKTNALRAIMPENAFDLSDVLTVYKATLDSGVVTGGSAEYRAGIPGESYEVKSSGLASGTHLLSYRTALKGCLTATWRGKNISFSERVILSFLVLRFFVITVDHLARTFPDNARPHHIALSKILLQYAQAKAWLKKLKFRQQDAK